MRGESSVAPTHSDLSVFVLRYRNRAIQTFLLRVAFFCMISYTYGIFEKKTSKNKLQLYLVVDDLNDKDITYRVGKWS